ncbi:DeoR/GlpR family DNA-binding transcription regulator [Actinoallomurus iriomotensis]|uniref:DeoR family transcriptional regulator n=1 Tax=Actinoallomurus iriomotensis TaxID=478107 RepID=A0A9W6VLB5_9ACTN|nr:DeoR/GlpR family DNA-binding transcription regulator [Actinoallomurus iriomotensis]GLY72530.1 DeoR family transcriptional regulator [Actinoallomurus iriomotensis]
MRSRKDPASRQQDLAEHILRVGTATAQELAERFGVSLVTAHRDLDELAKRGLVRKFHGGVTAQPSSVFESNVTYRRQLAVAEKRAIARAAVELIEPGMSVLLDDSTTTLVLAELAADIDPLTVITNFAPIIQLMMGRKNIRLIALGGEYNEAHDAFLGSPCTASARALHSDLGFYSFAGVSDGGVHHQEQEIVVTKRALLSVATHRVLLVDHAKLGRTALHRVADLADFAHAITDSGAPPDALAALTDHDVPTTVAGAS